MHYSQVLWILMSFFAFSLPLGGSRLDPLSLCTLMTGYFLWVVVYIIHLTLFIFKTDHLNKSFLAIRDVLEEERAESGDSKSLRTLAGEIERARLVSGYGLFQMDRTTLTGMISVAVTYLIILIQFKQSFNA